MLNLLRAPVLGHTKVTRGQLSRHFSCAYLFYMFQFVLLEPYCKIIGTSVSKFNFSSKLLYDLCEAGYELFAKVNVLPVGIEVTTPLLARKVLFERKVKSHQVTLPT